jgi:hypothetical protein
LSEASVPDLIHHAVDFVLLLLYPRIRRRSDRGFWVAATMELKLCELADTHIPQDHAVHVMALLLTPKLHLVHLRADIDRDRST